MASVDDAMHLFGLQHRQLFRNDKVGAHVLVAWSGSLIVLCARGSQVTANFAHDLRVRCNAARTMHEQLLASASR